MAAAVEVRNGVAGRGRGGEGLSAEKIVGEPAVYTHACKHNIYIYIYFHVCLYTHIYICINDVQYNVIIL